MSGDPSDPDEIEGARLFDTTASAGDGDDDVDRPESATRLNDGEGLEIAKPEDFNIRRGPDGDLLPVMQRIPGTEKAIKVKPISGGAREKYGDILSGQSGDEERMAELWNDHIIEGVGSAVTPQELNDVIPYGLIAGVNQALKNSSAEDVFIAVRQQQNEEIQANMGAMEALGPDAMGAIMSQLGEDLNPETNGENNSNGSSEN